ncbi:DUF4383 domain-containing protein [Prauserella cavernicola]|uniref:DUF4383 domain-containing protein n=1 Tax=Prauserella cavernicola TaxID=2800127 RepID=A0A934QNZ1_9PSEU|nr:DUF4383 domain-containing protein [Prauserella cavernicola]MBK1783363.1 DUF4383 domain-containing protein [Prauserella cavernicola]
MSRAVRAEVSRGGQLPALAAVISALFLFAAFAGLLSLFALPHLSIAQSVVYAGLGAWGWKVSRTVAGAQQFLRGAGIVCLVLWFVGVFAGSSNPLEFLGLDPVANLVHLGVAILVFLVATGAPSQLSVE